MEFKGTKGKWVLLKGYNSCGVSVGNKSTMVFSNGDDEELANAQLISKAPEMLEMLKRVYNETNHNTPLYPEILKLIKEATEL